MFDISVISDIGSREVNQDYCDYYVNKNDFILVVCDGLGSYKGSDIVSKTACVNIISHLKKALKGKNIDLNTLHNAIFTTYNDIIKAKENNISLQSSCTTLAVVFKAGDVTYIAHIGDTRIYLFKDNIPYFITKDHSLAYQAVENGEITFEQIPSHPNQNKLTKVFGSAYFVQPDYATLSEKLTSSDTILLATDGFWEYVTNEDMENILSSTATSEQALDKMKELINLRKNEYNDNFSAILLRIKDEGIDK